jgi:hypothetical protein
MSNSLRSREENPQLAQDHLHTQRIDTQSPPPSLLSPVKYTVIYQNGESQTFHAKGSALVLLGCRSRSQNGFRQNFRPQNPDGTNYSKERQDMSHCLLAIELAYHLVHNRELSGIALRNHFFGNRTQTYCRVRKISG